MKHILLTFLIALTVHVYSNAQTLQIDPVHEGGTVTIEVLNGIPDAAIFTCYSVSGAGPHTLGNGVTLDLSAPIRYIDAFYLDALGNGIKGPFPLPNKALAGQQLYVQAVQYHWSSPVIEVTNMVPIVVGAGGGSLVLWGADWDGQVTDTPPGNDFTQVAAGAGHCVALLDDGSLASWGRDDYLQVTDTPAGNDFAQVAGGGYYSVALRSDGSLVSWGSDNYLQITDTPAGNNFTQVSAGHWHSIAITF